MIKTKKKVFANVSFTVLLLVLINTSVFAAYPSKATMDNTWGFEKGDSTEKQLIYHQHGDLNWKGHVDFAMNEININPADISCYYGTSEDLANIVVTSNYWPDATWSGSTYAPIGLEPKTIELNSSAELTDWQRDAVTTHEFVHIWGINDSRNKNSISYGFTPVNYRTITDDVTTLLKNRYNEEVK
ncbi:hypothetical protein K144312032_15060 [Clostridium tetani]|uniref:hypothetical protein n=1 Tax=Clostridium tetani TaxID=1513 RepID=UPI002952FD16|nr:hypothetical protein [Clostridium tetani]BDR67278.1 hypothetical protein K144312032_15060 [Clostridium tetani]